MRDPAFWWRHGSLAGHLLAPLGAGYGAVVARRMAATGVRASLPVLCVGNFTLGGAGKTPTVIWLAKMLEAAGERPFCLSRGYGGDLTGPKIVDLKTDCAAQVGDEALLLARAAPMVVAHDRVTGARVAQTAGAKVVIMDDGLQNASLVKDFTMAVVDARRGIGNGYVFPAGPLRAPLNRQITQTDALLVMGEGAAARDVIAAAPGMPVFHGRLVPDAAAVAALKALKVLAFAGIGDPEKFFVTLGDASLAVVRHQAFADHHRYTAEEAAALIGEAERKGLVLLTTEKDHARMVGEPSLVALRNRAQVLPVTLVVDEAAELRALVLAKVRR